MELSAAWKLITERGAAVRAASTDPRFPWIVGLFVLTLGIVRGFANTGYSTYIIDEQVIVARAVGFLGGDLSPHWFGYFTLPMYLLAWVYGVEYMVLSAIGSVGSALEFAAGLFQDDALFYVTARFVFGLAQTVGAAFVGLMAYSGAQSRWAALLAFAVAFLAPDAARAATEIRVDTFVFTFSSGALYFACCAPKTARSFVLACVLAAAALCSKLPAIALYPVLFLTLLVDVIRGRYPKRYLAYFCLAPWPLVFVFMPYAFLDFDLFYKTILRVGNRVGGGFLHVGKEHYDSLGGSVRAIARCVSRDQGLLLPVAAALSVVAALWRPARALLPVALFGALYALAFAVGSMVDCYWLRPSYPLIGLAAVVATAGLPRLPWLARPLDAVGRRLRLPPGGCALGLSAALVAALGITYFLSGAGWSRLSENWNEDRVDTRLLATDWIVKNVEPGTTIYLEGYIQRYLPRVPTVNRDAAIANSYYNKRGLLRGNQFLSAAFDRYLEDVGRGPTFDVRPITGNKDNDYRLRSVLLREGAYLVTSHWIYKRFYKDFVKREVPRIARNARRFYALIKKQKLVKHFIGNGPNIHIYRLERKIDGAAIVENEKKRKAERRAAAKRRARRRSER